METDKTPQEQCSTSKNNEAHAPETDNKSFVDLITNTKGNNNTPGSSEDDFDEPNREGETVKSLEETVVESKIEGMQEPSSSNLEQESNDASAPYANKDVETATHADDLTDPKTEFNVSKNTLSKTKLFKDNYKSNQALPSGTPSNLILNLNELGQKQGNEIQPNKDECRELESTDYVVRNRIRTDNERDGDNDNNINKDTKDGAKDELDELPRPLTQSQEDCSSGKERDHESNNDRQTCLTEIQQNQFSESQTQIKTIGKTTDEDRQESEVETESDKTIDNEKYQNNFNCIESAKREHSKQNMVPECYQTGGTEIADQIATDEKVGKDILCQPNTEPREKTEVPHDDLSTPKLTGEDAQLSSKQVNSGIPDSEDEASSFYNKFESLEDDIEIIQLDELEKDKTLSSNLQEEKEIDLKEELEKEKKLSSKQREAYQKDIEKMKAELLQREEQLVNAKRNIVKLNESLDKKKIKEKEHEDRYLRLQEENNMNVAQIMSLLDKDRNNDLLIKSLQDEVTKLKIDKQSSATKEKGLTSQIENKDRLMHNQKRTIDELNKSLSKEKETLKQVKSQHSKQLKSEQDKASAIQQDLKRHNQKLSDANDRNRKEYESNLEGTKHYYEHVAKEKTQYWEAVKASLDEQIRIMAKRHDDLLHRYSKLAGESLTMGNANVTDLSDPSRPTKLGEQFSELYDNEWTDAFEELQNMTDSEKINHLLTILQRAYELSSDITTSEWLSHCYYTTFKEHKHLGISVCGKDIEATNIGAEREGFDRSKQPPKNSRDPNGDTSDIAGPTNIGANKEDTEQTEQSTTTDLQEHLRDSNRDIIHLSDPTQTGPKRENVDQTEQSIAKDAQEHQRDSGGDNTDFTDSTNTDARREEFGSEQTPTNDVHEHSQDSIGDTSDITDPTNIAGNETDTDQTEQSTTNDSHEQSPDPNGDITHLSTPTNIGAHETDTDQTEQSTTNDSQEQSPDSNGDITHLSDPTQTDPKRENVDQTEQSIEKDAQEHSRGSGGDTTDFTTIEQQTTDNNEKDDEQDSASGTDFQGESSVDPPSKTNKESIQIPADGTSVDPVADMPLVNKETVRVENLNLLVVEVPYGELKSEREQVAMKVLPHLKKKVLSCASEQLQQVITDCLMKEFDVPAQATNLVKFVEKCGELCLKMGLKDPPLHIDFMKEGISDQTLFNADQYKAYTKKGKYLHYVVWPCLFLEKDGPLLCKGTAQGRLD